MKKFPTNLTLALIVFFFGIAIGNTASADTYSSNCSGGGTVTSVVNLTPGTAPYTFGPGQTFNATGRITTSNCAVDKVSLTAKNNFGADENLILPTSIGINNSIPAFVPASHTFTTPNSQGIYKVSFITGLDETPFVQNYWWETDAGLITDVCSVWSPTPYTEGAYIIHRDADTDASAIARGKTHVVVKFNAVTDNVPTPCTRTFEADFYPGDLDVTAHFGDGIAAHDFTCGGAHNYCAGWGGSNDPYNQTVNPPQITEY